MYIQLLSDQLLLTEGVASLTRDDINGSLLQLAFNCLIEEVERLTNMILRRGGGGGGKREEGRKGENKEVKKIDGQSFELFMWCSYTVCVKLTDHHIIMQCEHQPAAKHLLCH